MENVLQIHTEAVSAQIAHFYEVCIRIIALLGSVERQTSYQRLTYFTSQLPFEHYYEYSFYLDIYKLIFCIRLSVCAIETPSLRSTNQ